MPFVSAMNTGMASSGFSTGSTVRNVVTAKLRAISSTRRHATASSLAAGRDPDDDLDADRHRERERAECLNPPQAALGNREIRELRAGQIPPQLVVLTKGDGGPQGPHGDQRQAEVASRGGPNPVGLAHD